VGRCRIRRCRAPRSSRTLPGFLSVLTENDVTATSFSRFALRDLRNRLIQLTRTGSKAVRPTRPQPTQQTELERGVWIDAFNAELGCIWRTTQAQLPHVVREITRDIARVSSRIEPNFSSHVAAAEGDRAANASHASKVPSG
jgi:hypothetical protein